MNSIPIYPYELTSSVLSLKYPVHLPYFTEFVIYSNKDEKSLNIKSEEI